MKLGLVGLPSSGKTSVFNAVSGAHGEVGSYHHAREVNHAVVRVPEPRLRRLAEIGRPRSVREATITFLDIPGVMAAPDQEQQLQRLAALREADALVHVVRFFERPSAPHPRGRLDPLRDAAEIAQELLLADLDVVERRLERLEKARNRPGQDREENAREERLLEACRRTLEAQKPLSEVELIPADRARLSPFAFLTMKPVVHVLNVGEDRLGRPETADLARRIAPETVVMCGQLEMELAELPEEERKEFIAGLHLGEPASARLVRTSYRALGLRSFFTGMDDDLRAWTVRAGDNAVTAAGKVHSDMARGFIRAEVVHFDDLDRCGSMKAARDAGKVRLEGRDYEVRDGDVILFRFNV